MYTYRYTNAHLTHTIPSPLPPPCQTPHTLIHSTTIPPHPLPQHTHKRVHVHKQTHTHTHTHTHTRALRWTRKRGVGQQVKKLTFVSHPPAAGFSVALVSWPGLCSCQNRTAHSCPPRPAKCSPPAHQEAAQLRSMEENGKHTHTHKLRNKKENWDARE